jgi:hypothetical protein
MEVSAPTKPEERTNHPRPLYDMASALKALELWLTEHLPDSTALPAVTAYIW